MVLAMIFKKIYDTIGSIYIYIYVFAGKYQQSIQNHWFCILFAKQYKIPLVLATVCKKVKATIGFIFHSKEGASCCSNISHPNTNFPKRLCQRYLQMENAKDSAEIVFLTFSVHGTNACPQCVCNTELFSLGRFPSTFHVYMFQYLKKYAMIAKA